MLLSDRRPGAKTNLKLPSHPKGIIIPQGVIPSDVPVRIRRKLLVVNDHLAVGVAGKVSHIRTFVADLAAQFQNRTEFTYADLECFLNQFTSRPEGGEVAALMVAEARDWRGSLTVGLHSRRELISPRFGRVIAIGSGSTAIMEQVKKLDSSYSYGFSQPPDGEANFPEFRSLAASFGLLGNFYWKEFTTPAHVLKAWGGIYELIYQDSNKVFQYLNDYTILLRMFDVSHPEKGIELMNVLKYERQYEFSFVAMLHDGRLDFFAAKDITASDLPSEVKIAGDGFTMNSKINISIIAVGREGRFLAPMIQIDGLDPTGQGRQTASTWFNEEGRLCVWFQSAHDEWLREQAIDYYQRNAASFS